MMLSPAEATEMMDLMDSDPVVRSISVQSMIKLTKLLDENTEPKVLFYGLVSLTNLVDDPKQLE